MEKTNNTTIKKQFAFKGASYKEDCNIFLSETIRNVSKHPRLYPQGVCISIEPSEVEKIRKNLQNELGFKVRIFTYPSE